MADAGASPEQVRRKWDALLGVINNVQGTGDISLGATGTAARGAGTRGDAGADSANTSPRASPLQAARDLLRQSSSLKASRTVPARQPGPRQPWDDKHHLMFSVLNDRMQKNVRTYFDRPREIEGYGLKHRNVLRTTWQLETPEAPPGPGLSSSQKKWQVGGSCCGGAAAAQAGQVTTSANLIVGGVAEKRKKVVATLQKRPELNHSESAPGLLLRELDWDGRHQVMFDKDNHHYHPNFREYFERPRGLLY
eukprot:TRINITY_DN23477_c0_g1_i1.p1 TRINITY_DN23477_c0_g1~~TRINITY_DN23477_c0_g1_i1.p1  ORF type:complete len:251 (+),score=55.67 TRINITY_DN23477_c0_g1_i1:174-926(+)